MQSRFARWMTSTAGRRTTLVVVGGGATARSKISARRPSSDVAASLVAIPLDTSVHRSAAPPVTLRGISTDVADARRPSDPYRRIDGSRVGASVSGRLLCRVPANRTMTPTMTPSTVHLAAYGDLGAALLDWDDLDLDCANGEILVVDAVLVEADDQTIRTLHRFSTRCSARGSASVSVVGLLKPSSLVTGALAGGVGERTISTLATALDRMAIKHLGDTMDLGGFTIILISGVSAGEGSAESRFARGDFLRSIASTSVTTERRRSRSSRRWSTTTRCDERTAVPGGVRELSRLGPVTGRRKSLAAPACRRCTMWRATASLADRLRRRGVRDHHHSRPERDVRRQPRRVVRAPSGVADRRRQRGRCLLPGAARRRRHRCDRPTIDRRLHRRQAARRALSDLARHPDVPPSPRRIAHRHHARDRTIPSVTAH